jgi:hypothetical protein
MSKCNICKMFDCGIKCQCNCHYGEKPTIRQDHNPQSEKQAMEGLSSLFG